MIRSGQLNPRRGGHPTYATPAITPRYLEFIQAVASLPLVYEWVETTAVANANLQWILTHLAPLSPNHTNDNSFVDEGERIVVTVQSAGVQEVNGTYHLDGTYGGAGIYRKRGVYGNLPVSYSLYRCANIHACRWYISIIAANCEPGSVDDIDFYMCDTHVTDRSPPRVQWIPCQGSHTRYPAPIITYTTEYNDDSDDREDSVAAVDDEDRFNSLPGTPSGDINDTSF